MKLLSRGWTVYIRHKMWIKRVYLSDFDCVKQNPRVTHVEGVGTCSHHSPCFHGCMHMGEASVMHVVLTMERWNNGLRSEVVTQLVASYTQTFCRRIKASSLHLTTGTGNLQSCSPLVIRLLHYSLLGHKEKSGNKASITMIYPM